MDRDIGYYIRGRSVTWDEWARWVDMRTLNFRYQKNSLWVLFGRLGLDELHHVKEFCADQTSTGEIRRSYAPGAGSIRGHVRVH